MPELPDITVYIEALERRIVGVPLEGIRVNNPFLVRTYDPPLEAASNKTVRQIRRVGKRIAIGLDDDLWLVLHLMIAGRLHWKPRTVKISGKLNLAAFDFPRGSLLLTEAGTKRRASLHLLRGEVALRTQDPGGLEVLTTTLKSFQNALRQENHTLKRALTDPHIFSGIGNAYSDEILHRARLSPLALTQKLSDDEAGQLFRESRPCSRSGSIVSDWRPAMAFPKRSPHSARKWPCMAATACLAPSVPLPSSGSATPITRPTTAPAARPRAASLPIVPSRACSRTTGRATSTSWKRNESTGTRDVKLLAL